MDFFYFEVSWKHTEELIWIFSRKTLWIEQDTTICREALIASSKQANVFDHRTCQHLTLIRDSRFIVQSLCPVIPVVSAPVPTPLNGIQKRMISRRERSAKMSRKIAIFFCWPVQSRSLWDWRKITEIESEFVSFFFCLTVYSMSVGRAWGVSFGTRTKVRRGIFFNPFIFAVDAKKSISDLSLILLCVSKLSVFA